jgi:hypothetical protein
MVENEVVSTSLPEASNSRKMLNHMKQVAELTTKHFSLALCFALFGPS